MQEGEPDGCYHIECRLKSQSTECRQVRPPARPTGETLHDEDNGAQPVKTGVTRDAPEPGVGEPTHRDAEDAWTDAERWYLPA